MSWPVSFASAKLFTRSTVVAVSVVRSSIPSPFFGSSSGFLCARSALWISAFGARTTYTTNRPSALNAGSVPRGSSTSFPVVKS